MDDQDLHAFIEGWIAAWNDHDLVAVLDAMADDVVFEHWNGVRLRGKRKLELAWGPWFLNHGDFRFDIRGICANAAGTAASFEWSLDWPKPGGKDPAERECLDGVDCIQLRNGLVVEKRSYIKTVARAMNA